MLKVKVELRASHAPRQAHRVLHTLLEPLCFLARGVLVWVFQEALLTNCMADHGSAGAEPFKGVKPLALCFGAGFCLSKGQAVGRRPQENGEDDEAMQGRHCILPLTASYQRKQMQPSCRPSLRTRGRGAACLNLDHPLSPRADVRHHYAGENLELI